MSLLAQTFHFHQKFRIYLASTSTVPPASLLSRAQRSDSKTKRGSIPEDGSYSRRHCCHSYTASCSGRPFRPSLRLLPARRHRHCCHWLASPAASVPALHPVLVRQCLAAVSFNSHDLSHRRKLLQDTRYIGAQVSHPGLE